MWEYLIQGIPKIQTLNDAENWFNILGESGWELCTKEWGYFIFKRKLRE
jgi:hypothetical protein